MEGAASQDHAIPQSRLSLNNAAELFAQRRDSNRGPQSEASVEDPPERRALSRDSASDPDPSVERQADQDSPDAVSEQEEAAEESVDQGPLALSDDQVVRLPDGTELPVKELQRGLLREADYTQKTQALAERRKVMDEAAQVLSYHLGTQKQKLTAELQQFQSINWPELYDKDPAEFQRKRLRYDQARENWAGSQRAERDFLTHVTRTQEVEAQQRRTEAVQHLTKHYPGGWSEGEYQGLLTYAASQGWPKESVEGWDDPKVFLMLRKARAFDEASKVGTKKVVNRAADKTLPSNRGAAPKPSQDSQKKASLDQIKSASSRVSQLSIAAQMLADARKTKRPR